MYESQYQLLFAAGVLLSIGGYLGHARTMSGIVGFFTWIVLGNASTFIQVQPGGGAGEVVYGSGAIGWLCYFNAIVLLLTFFIGIYEWVQESAEDAQDASQNANDPRAVIG